MYSDWLHIYYSSTDKVPVKGEKKNQDIKKEILADNTIKISGILPKKWEVLLESAIYMSLIEYENKLKNNIINSKKILYNSFTENDKKNLKREKLYINSMKHLEEINTFKQKNIKKYLN